MTDATAEARGQSGLEYDEEDEPGGPAHPAPGHLPPDPEPEQEPDDEDEDEPGGPSHPAPGHLPPEATNSKTYR